MARNVGERRRWSTAPLRAVERAPVRRGQGPRARQARRHWAAPGRPAARASGRRRGLGGAPGRGFEEPRRAPASATRDEGGALRPARTGASVLSRPRPCQPPGQPLAALVHALSHTFSIQSRPSTTCVDVRRRAARRAARSPRVRRLCRSNAGAMPVPLCPKRPGSRGDAAPKPKALPRREPTLTVRGDLGRRRAAQASDSLPGTPGHASVGELRGQDVVLVEQVSVGHAAAGALFFDDRRLQARSSAGQELGAACHATCKRVCVSITLSSCLDLSFSLRLSACPSLTVSLFVSLPQA